MAERNVACLPCSPVLFNPATLARVAAASIHRRNNLFPMDLFRLLSFTLQMYPNLVFIDRKDFSISESTPVNATFLYVPLIEDI